MKSDWKLVLLFFVLTPLPVLASGDYVMTALFIDFIVFFVIVFGIIKAGIGWTGKIVLFTSYLVAMYLLLYYINRVNYLNNLTLINLGSALFPPTVVYLIYLGIKNKFKRYGS